MKFLILLAPMSVASVSYSFESARQFDLIKTERSDCAQQAVSEIMPFCIAGNTLTPSMRRSLAIELSICEFELAGIVYPSICKSIGSDDEEAICIMELEASPQFWTTFSGYYRDVRTICYEESLPYEKEQVINLFSNITTIYETFYTEMKQSRAYSEEAQSQLQARFEDMVSIFNTMVDELYVYHQEMNEDFKEFSANVGLILDTALHVISDTASSYTDDLQVIGAHLNFFAAEMEQVAKTVSNIDLRHFQDQIIDSYAVLSDKSRQFLDELTFGMDLATLVSQINQQLAQEINAELTLTSSMVSNLNISSLLENITEYLNKELETTLLESQVIMDTFLNVSFHRIDSKLNETFSNLQSFTVGFDIVFSQINNMIGCIMGVISLISRYSIWALSSSFLASFHGAISIIGSVIILMILKKVAKKINFNIRGIIQTLTLIPVISGGIIMAMVVIKMNTNAQ